MIPGEDCNDLVSSVFCTNGQPRGCSPTLVSELVSVIAGPRHRKAGGREESLDCCHGNLNKSNKLNGIE